MATSKAGLAGTIGVHAALVAGVFWAARIEAEQPRVFHGITLIASAAPSSDAVPDTKPVVKAPPPVKNEKLAPILPPKKTVEKPKPEPKKTDPKPEPVRTTATEPPVQGVKPNNGQDALNLRIEGIAGKYPDYERNIFNKVAQQWFSVPNHPPLETEVEFVIHANGSVSDIRTSRSSRNPGFDSDGRATIEVIGNRKGFGPLPGGLTELPVSFTIKGKP